MGMLDRTALLKKEKLQIEKVDLGNGDFAFVRQMTGIERDAFEESMVVEVEREDGYKDYKRSLGNFRARLAASTLCDDKGNALLKLSDASILGQNMSAAKLEKIVAQAQKLNRISQEDREVMVKNSADGQVEGSPSDSAKS